MVASAGQIATALAGSALLLNFSFEWRTAQYGFIADVTPAVMRETGAIKLDNMTAGAGRVLNSLTVRKDLLPMGFDIGASYLAVFADLAIPAVSSDYIERFALGLYKLDAPTEPLSSGTGTLATLNGASLGAQLIASEHADPFRVAAGTDYATAVSARVTADGYLSGISALGITTPNDFVWAPTASDATICNDLLAGVNYYPIWFDATARAKITQRLDPIGLTPDVTYSTLVEPRMVLDVATPRSMATQRYPNRAVIRVNDPLRLQFSSYAQNDDPSSPISTVTRGTTTNVQRDVPTTVNAATAQNAANMELVLAAAQAKQLLLSTRPDPRRTAHETYLVTLGADEVATQWMVLDWTLPFTSNGAMIHTLGTARNTAITVGNL